MDNAGLVTPNVQAGAALVRALDLNGMPPETAVWIYDVDRDDWRLLLQFQGDPEKFATLVAIGEILRENEEIAEGLWQSAINVVDSSDDVVVAVKSIIQTGHGVSFMSFGPSIANGVYIEKGVAYRVLAPLVAK